MPQEPEDRFSRMGRANDHRDWSTRRRVVRQPAGGAGANKMRGKLFLVAVSLTALISPAWGFGFTVGPQIEERFGSEYGSEYYYRNVEHCRVVVVKDRKGRR